MSKSNPTQGYGPSIRVVREDAPFAVVPDDIFGAEGLSMKAQLVAAWLVSRPPNWDIRIWYIKELFRIKSESTWKKIRRELESQGYYQQRRYNDGKGRVCWDRVFYYPPRPTGQKSATVGLSGDGNEGHVTRCSEGKCSGESENTTSQKSTIPSFSMDGKSMHGKAGDITIGDKQKHSGSGGSDSRKRLSDQLDLSQLDPGYQRQAAALLDGTGLSTDLAQQAVDELTGAIRHRTGTDDPIRSPIAYLRKLISHAQDGTLMPDHSVREREVRLGLIDAEVATETVSDATPSDGDTETRQLRQEWEALFDTHFWPAVWKKHDKQGARRGWMKLCPKTPEAGQQLHDAIMAGVERYKAFLAANPDRSVKYPQGWLNDRRWEDEFDQQDMTGNAVIGRERVFRRKSALDEMLDSAREYIAQEGL